MSVLPNQNIPMYTQEHIVSLLHVISEQRKHIETLREELELAEGNVNRYRTWWQEDDAKVKELTEQINKQTSESK